MSWNSVRRSIAQAIHPETAYERIWSVNALLFLGWLFIVGLFAMTMLAFHVAGVNLSGLKQSIVTFFGCTTAAFVVAALVKRKKRLHVIAEWVEVDRAAELGAVLEDSDSGNWRNSSRWN